MKRAFALITVPALAIALAACGDGDDNGASTGHSMPAHSMPAHSMPAHSASPGGAQAGPHNGQDVMFAQMMIPHHRQAVEMAGLAAARASSAQVKTLAADIEKAQEPEIQQLSAWLKGWGAPVPSPGATGMGGMHHGGTGGMDGMMSEKDMKELEAAKGKAFDRAFLEMMIEHHEGAVAMARTEQSSGQFPPAKQMAGSIVSSQTAEIEKMRTLLKR
ncbi:uncharacterized protein (DUF305 family) [Actinomadura coerulea]|uniref:Uncharacterized protein (DUF305 family) n=1 Tax=Actinomadura coerulea TaxID=46159 RepID=A0A7X0G6Z7_9ACTN|nr:DUF305 domain-containing protein [Actinomadura coerulea]MBB6399401.1 uncharacterized protein (DUF305 family) [Actinomadura coerulea]GGQ28642.1 lipoprotein [Actinomadura coerulea]